ncbi:hypothetical protein [Nonomuraea sp. SYSU D8015]|uniref:hypothetical protein n=1 Tax=Nonomuraea sp. SYSU D8015 TaxID=2593644 RepID=UPI001660432D|nr:hypothetical protein [Nonomuraea sp. SYSU D8015]
MGIDGELHVGARGPRRRARPGSANEVFAAAEQGASTALAVVEAEGQHIGHSGVLLGAVTRAGKRAWELIFEARLRPLNWFAAGHKSSLRW